MGNILFWFFWCLTLAVCSQMVINGLQTARRVLEWPFFIGLICSYFFVFMPVYAVQFGEDTLTANASMLGQGVAFFCIVAMNVGWNIGRKKHFALKRYSTRMADLQSGATMWQKKYFALRRYSTYSWSGIWFTGVALMVVATVVHLGFREELLSDKTSFQNTSAYRYLFFYVGYPGFAASLWALCKMKPKDRVVFRTASIIILLIFLFPHVYSARRGPLFPAVIILLLVPPLALNIAPKRWLIAGSIVITGFIMLAFVEARKFVYGERTWSDALMELSFTEVSQSKAYRETDNEFVNHCNLIATLQNNGKYQFGTGHLSLLVHWIPRQLWPEKGALGEGYYSNEELLNDVNAFAGHSFIGGGAAAGGFADSFIQYGFAAPLFWFLVSMFAGKYYVIAVENSDASSTFSYVAIVSTSHWLLSQGFAAAFVPGVIFFIIPKLILYFNRSAPAGIKARVSHLNR